MTEKRPSLAVGVVADDMTGASDVALMLARGGLSTVQMIGVPAGALPAADAIVVALKTRTIAPAEAIAQSLAAARALRQAGAAQLLFKYCSTFDSTPRGNIGPVADALMEELGAEIALVCPAFPATGRTIYQGYLFVGGVPLDESPMKDHPLTPMRDANLMRLMAAQSRHPVGLVAIDTVRQGAEAVRARLAELKADGKRYAVADALEDHDLRLLAEATRDHPLLTGGSGIALGLPELHQRGGAGAAPPAFHLAQAERAAILAGSCSAMTRRQVAAAKQAGIPAFEIDPLALHDGTIDADSLTAFALSQTGPALLYSSADPQAVGRVQERLGREAAGALIENALAAAAHRLVERGMRRLIVAGGETSGAVVQKLGIKALAIGPEIDPGVPWMRVTDGPPGTTGLTITLKSGNFGGEDFFLKALA